MRKRQVIISLFVSLALLLSAFPLLTVSASTEVTTLNQLVTAMQANDNILLQADIVLSNWTPLAYEATLEGNGHVITLEEDALFSSLGGTVTNLGVVAEQPIDAEGLFAEAVTGTVEHCFAYGSLAYTGSGTVGGFVGTLDGGRISDSFSCVSLSSESASYAGGFIGKITNSATVTDCYSAGDIDVTQGVVTGFAYLHDGEVEGTYTSCQLLNFGVDAKPSGVNGYYDNQMGLCRESSSNGGLTTRELLETEISEAFAVTSTAYPSLKTFYANNWSDIVEDIVAISTAAVAFSDADSSRAEPSYTAQDGTKVFVARADYLTYDTYLDRTNAIGFSWTLDSQNGKLYDTVPMTSASFSGNSVLSTASGTASDLLRGRVKFSDDTREASLTVTRLDYSRTWYLSAYNANPYFASGNGDDTDTPFVIQTVEQLDHVRYYSRFGHVYYQVGNDFEVSSLQDDGETYSEFIPIEDFNGAFDGNDHILSNIRLDTDRGETIGLFANSQSGSSISDLTIQNVTVSADDTAVVGALIGKAVGTTVSGVLMVGATNQLSGGTVGGLVGEAVNTTLTGVLVSVEATGKVACGGIAAQMAGGTLSQSGATGYVTGYTPIGGLVAQTGSNTQVENCYSTVAVFSSADGTVYAGGLVGRNNGTVSGSYAANVTDAPGSGAGYVGPLAGNGTVTASYYDSTYNTVADAAGTPLSTEEMIAANGWDANIWTVSDNYPQLSVFADATRFQALSALSTEPVYFQKYWTDIETDDMTTGWIADNFNSYGQFATPTTLSSLAVSSATVYTVDYEDGYGFEAAGGSRLLVLRCEGYSQIPDGSATNDGDIGVRVIAAVRHGMIRYAYEVVGVSGVNTYLELYYGSESDGWQGSQVMSQSGGDAQVLYDIPKESYIKLLVHTEDDYKVASVVVGDTPLNYQDGYYISEEALSTDITVTVTLQEVTPPWGFRRQSY